MDPIRILVVLGLIAVVTVLGRWWQSRDGQVAETAPDGDGRFDPDQLVALGLGDVGTPYRALLLGSPTCAPCTTVKGVLTDLTEARDDVAWTYVDAADHLDIADDHRVLRVPTLFVLDADGRILARTSGVPARRDLEAVLDRRATALAA